MKKKKSNKFIMTLTELSIVKKHKQTAKNLN